VQLFINVKAVVPMCFRYYRSKT